MPMTMALPSWRYREYYEYRLFNVNHDAAQPGRPLPLRTLSFTSTELGNFRRMLVNEYPQWFASEAQAEAYITDSHPAMPPATNARETVTRHFFDNKTIPNTRIHIKAVRQAL